MRCFPFALVSLSGVGTLGLEPLHHGLGELGEQAIGILLEVECEQHGIVALLDGVPESQFDIVLVIGRKLVGRPFSEVKISTQRGFLPRRLGAASLRFDFHAGLFEHLLHGEVRLPHGRCQGRGVGRIGARPV